MVNRTFANTSFHANHQGPRPKERRIINPRIMQYEVTIGIPIYNAPKDVLKKCILSALNQTEEDIEVLAVDDCSTDGSADIIAAIAKQHKNGKRLKLVKHEKNIGVSGTRNTILDEARGKYLFFMDCDDYIPDDAIAILLELARKHDADTTWGSTRVAEGDEKEVKDFKIFPTIVLLDKKEVAKHCDIFRLHWFPAIWNILYKTEFLRSKQLRFKPYGTFDDYIFQMEMLPFLNSVAFTSRCTYYWVTREGSQSHVQRRQLSRSHAENAIEAEKVVKTYYENIPDKSLHEYYLPIIYAHSFYSAYSIASKRKLFTPTFKKQDVKSILSPTLPLKTLVQCKHHRLEHIGFYLLSKCPASFMPMILKLMVKRTNMK